MSSLWLRHVDHETMAGMDMSDAAGTDSTSSSTMAPMSMDFTTSVAPLWLSTFLPSSPGAIFGACLALISLAIASRLLYALERLLQAGWVKQGWKRERRREEHEREKVEKKRGRRRRGEDRSADAGEEGQNERRDRISGTTRRSPSWWAGIDIPRGLFQMLTSAVGYLLMLAVMTFNIYYFISVLIGLGIGESAFGRYGRPPRLTSNTRGGQEDQHRSLASGNGGGGPPGGGGGGGSGSGVNANDATSASASASSSSGGFRSFSGDGSAIEVEGTRLEELNGRTGGSRRAYHTGDVEWIGDGVKERGKESRVAHCQQAIGSHQINLLDTASGISSNSSGSSIKVEGGQGAKRQGGGGGLYELDHASAL